MTSITRTVPTLEEMSPVNGGSTRKEMWLHCAEEDSGVWLRPGPRLDQWLLASTAIHALVNSCRPQGLGLSAWAQCRSPMCWSRVPVWPAYEAESPSAGPIDCRREVPLAALLPETPTLTSYFPHHKTPNWHAFGR